jgi:Flp pilus assembly protein TadD/cell division septation protein DedD
MRNAFMLRFAVSSVVLLSAAANAAAISEAVKSATQAERALAKAKPAEAVGAAEAAVAAEPRDAGYRMLLGRAYLGSGRFRSAATSFADALALDPQRGGAALSLALTKLGIGDRAGAREVLDAHVQLIAPSDRGLAIALAGDPAAGVSLLEDTVRNGGADAKTRQNLALSYALAGRWAEAKLMAAYDLDPQTVSRRILEWSSYTGEGQTVAQVAALLGVQPGDDAGQPTRLALNALPSPTPNTAPVRTAESAPPPPPPVAMTAEVTADASAPASVATATAIEVAEAKAVFTPPVALAAAPSVQFAARSEIVQKIAPAPQPWVAKQVAKPVAQPAVRFQRAAFVRPTGGRFVVQIGAFSSRAVAEDGWTRAVRRVSAFGGMTPSTAVFQKAGTTFYRLSVSGFDTRATAVTFCERFRSRGGQCFVREQAGDAPLQWAQRKGGSPVRLAAR